MRRGSWAWTSCEGRGLCVGLALIKEKRSEVALVAEGLQSRRRQDIDIQRSALRHSL